MAEREVGKTDEVGKAEKVNVGKYDDGGTFATCGGGTFEWHTRLSSGLTIQEAQQNQQDRLQKCSYGRSKRHQVLHYDFFWQVSGMHFPGYCQCWHY